MWGVPIPCMGSACLRTGGGGNKVSCQVAVFSSCTEIKEGQMGMSFRHAQSALRHNKVRSDTTKCAQTQQGALRHTNCAQTQQGALRHNKVRSDTTKCAQTQQSALGHIKVRSDTTRCAQTQQGALRHNEVRSDTQSGLRHNKVRSCTRLFLCVHASRA